MAGSLYEGSQHLLIFYAPINSMNLTVLWSHDITRYYRQSLIIEMNKLGPIRIRGSGAGRIMARTYVVRLLGTGIDM
jgi:hypothetical protein